MAPSETPKPADTDIFKSVLSLEEEFYNEGYSDGTKDSKRAGITEGKQFGIQTAFQRFRSVGVVQARLDSWKAKADELPDQSAKNKVMKNISQLQSYLDEMPMSNKEEDVEMFEKSWKKAKSKARVIHASIKDGSPSLNYYDDNLGTKPTEETIEDHTASLSSTMVTNLH